MFVKFENAKSVHQCGTLSDAELATGLWVTVNDSLAGQRLLQVGDVIRAMSDDELAAERAELKTASAGRSLRFDRDSKLTACDWTQSVDSPLSKERKTAWAQYRQALRDIPSQAVFPDVVWPVEPA